MLLSNTVPFFALAFLAAHSQASLIKRDAQPEAIPHDVVDRGSLDTSVVEPDYSSNVLEQRAPKMEWLNGRENRILRALARGIERKIYTTDLVLFLGNSGSYLLYPFDEDKWNMHSLPISKTKYYDTDGADGKGIPTDEGLDRYWDKVLEQRLYAPGKKDYDRIVLVDHSSSGRSLDGFREAFIDLLRRAAQKKKISWEEARRLRHLPMAFQNVVDYRRRSGGGHEAIPPISDKIHTLSVLTAQVEEGEIDVILADKDKHPRVACEYYPRRWHKSVQACWDHDGGKENALEQRAQIKEWNLKNGGLIGPSPES